MSLSSRRIYLDLLFLFKCLHGQYDLDVSGYLQFYELEHESYNTKNEYAVGNPQNRNELP